MAGKTIPEEPVGPVLVRDDPPQPFVEHLEDLRRRLLRGFLWLTLGSVVAWRFADRLLAFIAAPVGKLVYLSPVEPFGVHLKTAFLGGVVLSFPLLVWEVGGFFRPALRRTQRWPVLILLPICTGLFLIGAAFGWAVLLPTALKVLQAFGSQTGILVPMLTVEHYLSFAGWLVVGCGLIFQAPVAILVLTRWGVVRPSVLVRQWRPAVVAILLAAAVLTPTPDVFTQLLLALPLAALYFVSVGLSFLVAG